VRGCVVLEKILEHAENTEQWDLVKVFGTRDARLLGLALFDSNTEQFVRTIVCRPSGHELRFEMLENHYFGVHPY
jgi:hypothetical protein